MSLWTLLEILQTTYCERSGFGPFDEPLNVISNLAFAIAAVLAARPMRAFPGISPAARLLPWSLATVALGSTIYHTYRSAVTFVVDLLFLSAFIVLSIYLVLRKLLVSTSDAALLSTAFVGLQIALLILVPNDFLNGSTPHVATLLFLLQIKALTAHRYSSIEWYVVPLVIFYALAVVFRTIDMTICPWLPAGSHFLWHISASAAGFFVVRFVTLIEVATRRTQA